MMSHETFARRYGTGTSACLLAGLVLFSTWLPTAFSMARGGTREISPPQFLLELLALAGVGALGLVLRRPPPTPLDTSKGQALLAEAGRVLQPMAGTKALGEALTRLCVPRMGDACILYVPGEDGVLRPEAVASAEDVAARLWEPLLRHPEPREPGPGNVVLTGRGELHAVLDTRRLPRALQGTAHGELLQALEVRSALTVPLTVGSRVVGALCLLSMRPHRRYCASDQVLLQELATRAALALDNARLLADAQGVLDLIGVAAHDLGSPLSSLQLRLGRLRRMTDPQSAPLREGLVHAEAETHRLGRLVHDLLDLSRLSAGRMALEPEELDLAELVHTVVDRHVEQAATAGCELTVRASPGTTGRWDRLRLDRVITNLLGNALKFGAGGRVDIIVHADAQRARLVVRDHGIGIPAEAQKRLFGRFQRLNPDGPHPGTGLGLFIVRQLVEAHGGSVQVRSRAGEGAEFTVELPRTSPATSCLSAEAHA